MRSFSKKLAFVLAAAMVVTGFAPAAQAKAADDFSLNRTTATLYVNEGVNDKGSETLAEGLYGNVQTYDFNLKNKPADWKDYGYAWSTSDAAVATVVSGGLTTAVGVGEATISCVITDKATGDVAATLKAEVTVKANAAAVEVAAADGEEYDGTIVEAGQVIDLNRTMYDEDGNKTNKRGTYVTDLTRWIVEPADKGVTVDQSNGKYTIGEDAAGEYTLYCETYQSKKYDQATATSNKIVVTVLDATFDVKQDTLTQFTVKFDNAVKTLGDVTITRLYETATATYEFPVVVKEAKLAQDGKSATVSVYSNLLNNVNYVISVEGYDDYIMTASAGAPATMTISSSATTVSPFVTAAKETALSYKLYDANGVDVTTGSETVLFNAKEYSTDGSYYVAGNMIWFAKSGLSTTVTAEYQSGKFENGIQVGNVSTEMDFVSVDATPVTLKNVSATLLNAKMEDTKTLEVPMNDTAYLQVKATLSEGGPFVIKTGDTVANLGVISFEETTPNVLALDKSSMQLYMFNVGPAVIIVNATSTDNNGNYTTVPVGAVTVNVKAARTLNTVTVDKALATVGTVDGFDTVDVKFSAKDQYGADYPITSVVLDGTTDAADAVMSAITVAADNSKVTVDGSAMASALGTSNAVQLTYKAKINNSKEVSFSVLVKQKSDNANTDYISIETSNAFGDVARTVDSKDAKSVTFTVYTMNNGVKVGYKDVEAYPSDVKTAVNGNYYFKVTKNGNDITSQVVPTGNGATVNFSSTEEITNGAVSGSAVTYGLGAGNYAFTLYKCIVSGTTPVLVQQQTVTGTTTCNTGSYSAAVRVAETVAAAEQDLVRACFKVYDTKGKEATAPYYVDMDASATDYVYVKSITFYDEVAEGVYAPYTVNVGVALQKKAQ